MFRSTTDGRIQLTEPLHVTALDVPGATCQITVPAGFVSDGASIPSLLWPIIGPPIGERYCTRKVRVRLKDCWAPESHQTKHPSEKTRGLKAKQILESEILGSPARLRITPDGDEDLGDGLTFGRVVGEIFLESGVNIGEQMVARGLAYRTKAELEKSLTRTDRNV